MPSFYGEGRACNGRGIVRVYSGGLSITEKTYIRSKFSFTRTDYDEVVILQGYQEISR